jgi:hypothetical protein
MFDAVQARKHVTIKFVEKDFSKFAVYPVIAGYLIDYLGLDLLFNNVLKVKGKNFSFSGTEYLLSLATINFLGIKRLYKADDLLSDEYQLAKILGFKKQKFPLSRNLYLQLSKTDYWSVRRLSQASFELIKHKEEFFKNKRWLTLDIDQTKKITEGRKIEKAKPCYHAQKKGRLGLRISAASVDGIVFSQKLEPGNIGNSDAFDKLFTDTLNKLGQLRLGEKRIILRIDGGYFSTGTLKQIEEVGLQKKVDFVTRVKSNLKLVKEARVGKEKKFEKLYKDRDIQVLVLKDQKILDELDHTYKVLVIKDKQKQTKSKKKKITHTKRLYEYILVTSLKHWSAKRIIKFYKKRQLIENVFKEHNQSFKADKLPTHSFWGNALYFQMVSLVFNISFFFEKGVVGETIPQQYIRDYTRQIYRLGR